MKNQPAFPSVFDHERGMTLRDYFAAKALQGTIASGQIGNEEPCHEEYISIHAYARDAYRWADAMLKARET
jgi:hypothetical protein